MILDFLSISKTQKTLKSENNNIFLRTIKCCSLCFLKKNCSQSVFCIKPDRFYGQLTIQLIEPIDRPDFQNIDVKFR